MSLLNQTRETRVLRRAKSFREVTDFSRVGGLDNHLKTLREVIIFPLLHGNIFTHFKIKAPRGVLFHGPPGTGKTLVAGALASELSKEGIGKVTFFQRKGADVLDKWVGESEKNLRSLFEKAAKSRPSIIFFDELDGLAPIRSEKNDHIHSSVVATLLALMDGLDSKPGVIVIGATNRIEAIDPALRRPGRFDKELYFPLPGMESRKEIIQVHTSTWKHKPTPKFITSLADSTAGFSGADLQALISEAVLCCLRRLYPKIDTNSYSLKIEVETLKVEECDFLEARLNLAPSGMKQGHRIRLLSPIIKPLLMRQLDRILKYIQLLWPHFLQEQYKYIMENQRYAGRILLVGSNMQGLNSYLIPSTLKSLEHIPALIYDTRLFESIKTNFINVQLNFPAVIVLSRIDEWWDYIDECDQHSIVSTLEEIHAGLPILTIASCKTDVPATLHNFFYNNSTILIRIEDPNEEERENFLAPLFFDEKGLSFFRIYESSRKTGKKIRKGETDTNESREGVVTRRRKRAKNDDSDATGQVDLTESSLTAETKKGKRKCEQWNKALAKKIKIFENKFGTYQTTGSSSLCEIKSKIKHEKCDEGDHCHYESLTPFQSLRNKQYFTRVLSDLLNQRNFRRPSYSSSATIQTILCDKLIKTEPTEEKFVMPLSYRKNVDDVHMERIYNLWKHASLVTSKNMAVAQLELLYDVISACIGINQNSFETLVENMENVLKKIENSYQVIDVDL